MYVFVCAACSGKDGTGRCLLITDDCDELPNTCPYADYIKVNLDRSDPATCEWRYLRVSNDCINVCALLDIAKEAMESEKDKPLKCKILLKMDYSDEFIKGYATGLQYGIDTIESIQKQLREGL